LYSPHTMDARFRYDVFLTDKANQTTTGGESQEPCGHGGGNGAPIRVQRREAES
jgi:hypothetical protein